MVNLCLIDGWERLPECLMRVHNGTSMLNRSNRNHQSNHVKNHRLVRWLFPSKFTTLKSTSSTKRTSSSRGSGELQEVQGKLSAGLRSLDIMLRSMQSRREKVRVQRCHQIWMTLRFLPHSAKMCEIIFLEKIVVLLIIVINGCLVHHFSLND